MYFPLPDRFAVIRKTSNNEPYLQMIRSISITSDTDSLENVETQMQKTTLYESSRREFNPLKAKIVINNSVRTIDFWRIPCSLTNSPNLPILDFPTKYWLPRPTQRITMENPTKCMDYADRFLELFGLRSQSPRSVVRSRIDTPPASPISMRSEFTIESQEIEPEQITKPLALPAYVGDLLLEKAWKSEDTCPITAVPYKDIDHLSVTSCYHIFEKEAIHKWIEQRQICPVCRTFVRNIVSKEK